MSKITFIQPPSNYKPLSTLLKEASGSPYSSQQFHSEHAPSSLTSAGVLVHKETGNRFFVPFVVDPNQKRGTECLLELARIDAFNDGVGGYQWGGTSGEDGNYGRETLDKLVEFGLAERTGGYVPNALGGVWPEVRVTDVGRDVISGFRDWVVQRHPSQERGLG